MTDDDLIARLREDDTDFWHCEAADRIEALVKDKRWIIEERDRTFALMLARVEALVKEHDARPTWQEWKDILAAGYRQKARAERLEEALRLLHDNVVLAFPTLADLGPVANARAALKGADHE